MDFRKMLGCVYTAQGEVVCARNVGSVETFIDEKPNIIKGAVSDTLLNSAIQQNYCEVTAEVDPQGKSKFLFKKECSKT